MLSPIFLLFGWIVQILVCFYIVRRISTTSIRWVLTLVPCVLSTYMVAYDLPQLGMTSMLVVTYCWLTSIRLIHLTVLTPKQCPTFRSYISKILWMVFPIVPCSSYQHLKWPILYDFISACIKIIINHWMYRWLLVCSGSDSYVRLIMFFIFVLTFTFISDFQSAILRSVTRDKYMLKPTTNFPFLSHSLRDFWGRRYNQLVGTILRESVFQPILQHLSSTTVASLMTFFISGLLHVHLAWVAFGDPQPAMSNIVFFIVHGIACTIEAHTSFQVPVPLSWLFTQLFLLATASLQIGPFTRAGSDFYAVNAPPFFEQKWIPKLPVPNFCPK